LIGSGPHAGSRKLVRARVSRYGRRNIILVFLFIKGGRLVKGTTECPIHA